METIRRPIWKKDDYFQQNGIDMDADVVDLIEEVPLFWNFDHTMVIGRVTAIRLEDGEITGEVQTIDDYVDMLSGGCRLGGAYNYVQMNEDGTRVLKTTLTSVSVVPDPNLLPPKEKSE